MSELKVNKISPRSGTDVTLGDSGDAISVASGASLTSPGLTLSDNIFFNAASKGIYLGVTSATAANLLDDYEEGTWTPAITGATGVTNLEGSYTKVGNLVTVWVYMLNGNIGGSPTYEMTGLPFTVDATRSTTSSVASYNTFGSNATSVLGLISITTTVIDFIYNVNNSAWVTQNIQTSANAYLSFSASYIAN
jgi:hypothetical protein